VKIPDVLHDGKGRLPDPTADIQVWLTYDGYDKQRMPYGLGMNPRVNRNASGQSILEMWKTEYVQKEEWREMVLEMFDEEEEYTWKDHLGHLASPPWEQGQQIIFKLIPWTKENRVSRRAKRPSSGFPGTPPRPTHVLPFRGDPM
jgi:hypothetical protein